MSDVFAFKTFKNTQVTLTSDAAYKSWITRNWTKIGTGDFDGIATDMLTIIKEGITGSVQPEDADTVTHTLDKVGQVAGWLAQGLKEGKGLLGSIVNMNLMAKLTEGMDEGDRDEVQASIQKRLAFIIGYKAV